LSKLIRAEHKTNRWTWQASDILGSKYCLYLSNIPCRWWIWLPHMEGSCKYIE